MQNLAVILVFPQGDANIGATARAMKNFGFCDLRLIYPHTKIKDFGVRGNPVPHKTKTAYTWAVDARDILDNARIHDSLDGALQDISCMIAFTRRLGRHRKQHLTLTRAASQVAALASRGKSAIVFGQEDAGLSNEDIDRADIVVSIPTSEKLPSLNLAQTVLLACHEIRRQLLNTDSGSAPETDPADPGRPGTWYFASREEISPVLKKLEDTLSALGYEDKNDNPLKSKILNQFKRLFGRGGVTDRDIRMFDGLLARIVDRACYRR